MKVKLEGETLVIEAPLSMNKPSRSGNSTIVATTRGQQYIGRFHGKDTYLQLNVMQMETTGGLEVSGTEGSTEITAPKKAPGRAA